MDSKELEKHWQQYETRKAEFSKNKSYTIGENFKIKKESKQRDPDNRIPVPLAKMAVEDLHGYAGRPGDRKVFFETTTNLDEDNIEAQNGKDEYVDLMEQVYSYNDEEIETSELYEDGLIFGVGYEILWTTDNMELPNGTLTPEFRRVEPYTIELLFTSDLKPTKKKGLYFWKENEETRVIDVYYPLFKERYISIKQQDWIKESEDEQYPYTSVPIAEYKINRDALSLFKSEIPLIDAHDSLLSKSVNEVDRYNALITLFPGKISKEMKEKLAEIFVVDDLERFPADQWPKYLEKNLAGVTEFYSTLADRLEELFRKSIKVPDMSDDKFGGNQSGVAMSYKLIGLEFKATLIDTYFNKGIFQRNNLINDVIEAGTSGIDTAEYKTVVKEHRNLPIDEMARLDIATAMLGLGISKETILKVLPVTLVENAEKELKRIEAMETEDIIPPEEDDV